MKRLVFFVFLLAMIGTQFAYGQKLTVNEAKEYLDRSGCYFALDGVFYVDDETLDKAYEAPNSALIKKWYTYPKPGSAFRNFEYGFVEFKKNGTLLLYKIYEDYHIETTGTWQRSKLKLNTTVNYNTAKVIPNDNVTLRRRDEINKKQARVRKLGISKMNLTIQRLDKLLIFEAIDISWDFSCYLISEEYLNEKYLEKKAREEYEKEKEARYEAEKKARQEEEKFTEELKAKNKEAYSYAREGKLDEAIATIDKVIELQPKNPNWYDSKGEFLVAKGDKEGAKAMWEKVLSLDPKFGKNNSPLGRYIELLKYEGWQEVGENFSPNLSFRKIRVRKAKGVPGTYCFVFFTTSPNSNPRKEDTNYGVSYFMNWIYNGKPYKDKSFKKCTDVGDGWFEYEFSQKMYFSHYQQNAPKDCLKVLVEM